MSIVTLVGSSRMPSFLGDDDVHVELGAKARDALYQLERRHLQFLS